MGMIRSNHGALFALLVLMHRSASAGQTAHSARRARSPRGQSRGFDFTADQLGRLRHTDVSSEQSTSMAPHVAQRIPSRRGLEGMKRVDLQRLCKVRSSQRKGLPLMYEGLGCAGQPQE